MLDAIKRLAEVDKGYTGSLSAVLGQFPIIYSKCEQLCRGMSWSEPKLVIVEVIFDGQTVIYLI